MVTFYNSLIEIQRPTTSDLAGGGWKNTYAALSTIVADVQPVEFREAVAAGREVNNIAYNVYVDVNTDVNGKDRIVYLGSDYDIISIRIFPEAYIKVYIEKVI